MAIYTEKELEILRLINNLYNELVDRTGIEPDKYEREDACFGIKDDVLNITGRNRNISLIESCIDAFAVVHDCELSETMVRSCYANVVGMNDKYKLLEA